MAQLLCPLSADILQYYLACSPRASNPFQQVRARLPWEAPGRPWPLVSDVCSPPGPLSGPLTLGAVGRQLGEHRVGITHPLGLPSWRPQHMPSGVACSLLPTLGLLSFPGLPLANPATLGQLGRCGHGAFEGKPSAHCPSLPMALGVPRTTHLL